MQYYKKMIINISLKKKCLHRKSLCFFFFRNMLAEIGLQNNMYYGTIECCMIYELFLTRRKYRFRFPENIVLTTFKVYFFIKYFCYKCFIKRCFKVVCCIIISHIFCFYMFYFVLYIGKLSAEYGRFFFYIYFVKFAIYWVNLYEKSTLFNYL